MSLQWATVSQVSPLKIIIDGATTPVPAINATGGAITLGLRVVFDSVGLATDKQIAALAAVVPVTPADTGWLTLTLNSGLITTSGGTTPAYRIREGLVHFSGQVAPSSGTFATASLIVVGTLPAGARPSRRLNRQAGGNSQANSVRGYVEPSGTVNIVTGAAAVAYVDLSGYGPYIAEG